MKNLLYIFFFSLVFGLLLTPAAAQRKKQVAVLNFAFDAADRGYARDAYGANKNLCQNIANGLENRLGGLKTYVLVERRKVDDLLMREHQRVQSGVIDRNTAAEWGRFLGADYLIYGSVTLLEVDGIPENRRVPEDWDPRQLIAKVQVSFRLTDTTTGLLAITEQVIGISRAPENMPGGKPKRNVEEAVGAATDIWNLVRNKRLPRSSSSSQRMKLVERDHIRNAVLLAVDDAIAKMSTLLEKGGAAPEPAPEPVADLIGRVAKATGPSLVITGLDKTRIKIGDQLQVRRPDVVKDPTTGTINIFTEKIGEVEIIEIQAAVVIGSFTGRTPAQIGDVITNSSNVDVSKLNLTPSATPRSITPESKAPARMPPETRIKRNF